MKKKAYSSPEMTVIELKQQCQLLSYSGAANAPEVDFGIDELNMSGNDDVTFSDDMTVDFK